MIDIFKFLLIKIKNTKVPMKETSRILLMSLGLLLFSTQGNLSAQENTPKIETNSVSDPNAPSDPLVQKADDEAALRQDQEFRYNEALQEGDKLAESKEFDKAISKYDYVIRNVAPYRPQFDAAKLGLARIKIMQADEALAAKDYQKAKTLVDEAKLLAGNDRGINQAVKTFEKLNDKWNLQRKNVVAKENNPVITPQFKDSLQEVEKLFYEGDRLKETGQYDAARNRYERVLAIDQYNKAARQKLESLQKTQMDFAKTARENSRKEAMNQVTERWSEPVLAESVNPVKGIEMNAVVSNVAKMRKKLDDIIIKEISFNEAPIEDVVSFLTAKSREADPKGEGVNFVLKQPGSIAPNLTTVGSKAAAAPKAPAKIPPVTITLSNLSLNEILRFINTTTGLKTQIDDYAVVLLPQSDDATTLATRTFSIPAGFLNTTGASKTGVIDVKKDLTDKGVSFISEQSKAIFLASTSKLVVKNTQDQLDVIQGLIEAVALKEEPQVEIEARLAEFTDDALKELSFNYILAVSNSTRNALKQFGVGGTPSPLTAGGVASGNFLGATGLRDGRNNADGQFNTATSTSYGGLTQAKLDSLLNLYPFTDGATGTISNTTPGVIYPQTPNAFSASFSLDGNQVGMLLRAIEQLNGADILISPKVITRNRTTAKMEVGRELRYPSAYEPPDISTDEYAFNSNLVTQGTTVVILPNVRVPIPATPTDFKTENIGVSLSVTPTTYPDQRVDIKLDQEIKEFEGFINYGSEIVQGQVLGSGVFALTDGTLNQPVFNVRKLQTDMTIVNGQTVVMGGFIREDSQKVKDKIPFLGDLPLVGRLFRSEVDKSIKKNMMLFLTARLVNSKGKPFYETASGEVELSQNTQP